MELSKELKEKVQNAKNAEEAKKILKDAGVELTDAELDQASGGRVGRTSGTRMTKKGM